VKTTVALCTTLPALVEATPVTVTLYVPGAALVVVGVVVGVLLLELLLPQPAAVKSATERTAANRAPHRRRRGSVSSIMQASVAPEPAAYQGLRPEDGVFEASLSIPVAVVEFCWKAVRTKLVVTPVVELITTGVSEKE
jgi:hypothetical protein